MYARVSTISGSPDQMQTGIDDFREKVIPWVKENGGHGGILLVDRQTGTAVAATLWNDEETMRRSEEAADEHRRRVTDEMQSTQSPTVERYEVAVFDA